MAKVGLGLEITELRLGLPGVIDVPKVAEKSEKKRVYSEVYGEGSFTSDDSRSQRKINQVVGWPPVCSYRRKNSFGETDESGRSKVYVKVSMDGVPFLRKLDLGMHKGYSDLISALEKLFGCFGIIEKNEKDSETSEFYSLIYEDKDGDWMLVGDVPLGMFIESCKRLRIMKKSEAGGVGLYLKDPIQETIKADGSE